MASNVHVLTDFARQTTTTTGTGTLSLIAPASGYSAISSVGTGKRVRCVLEASNGGREVFEGVITSGSPDTLTRATILASTNGGAALNLPAGTHTVAIAPTAADITLATPRLIELGAGVTLSGGVLTLDCMGAASVAAAVSLTQNVTSLVLNNAPLRCGVRLQVTQSGGPWTFVQGALPAGSVVDGEWHVYSDATTTVIYLDTLDSGSSWMVQCNAPITSTNSVLAVREPLLAVACGNSIAAHDQYGNAGANGYDQRASLHLGNVFAGGPLRFHRMTATTRSDRNGVYSYSGQTLATINADLQTQWFDQFTAAGIEPEIFVGLALLENNISQGSTVSEMVAALDVWLANVRRFPNAIVVLCTPRPSFGYDSPSKIAAYEGITSHMLGLDNGVNTFVCRLNGYEDPALPGIPLSGYTDATVHPNTRGAQINARSIAATLRRILSAPKSYPLLSNNYGLAGSVAASAVTGVSGTMPTGAGISSLTNGGTIVSLAENPGWLISVTQAAGQTSGKTTFNTGAVSVSGGADTQVSGFWEIEIVSGAEHLGGLYVGARVQDSAGNLYQHYMVEVTANPDVDFADGDVLRYVQPPIIAQTAPITAVTPYFYLRHKTNGSGTVTSTGTVVVRVRSTGVGIVDVPSAVTTGALDIDGLTDIGADLVDADTIPVYDGSATANRKSAISRIWTYIQTKFGTGIATALGINVGTSGSVVVNGGALGTPASGTLTNCTGLPAAGLVASTSQAVGFGTVELGHASDTTLSRSAAGVAAVEGVPLTRTIASGTATLGTSAIASGASASLVTVTATGVLTTDAITWGFNGNPNGVTGYNGAGTSGALTITAYPTAGNVNFVVSNPTSSSITPGALTLNWRVTR